MVTKRIIFLTLALVLLIILAVGCSQQTSLPQTYSLTVTTEGNGTVEKSPDKDSYKENTSVKLTASPDEGWKFDHWEGSGFDGETNNTITLTITDDTNIKAIFVRKEYPLNINIEGQGDVQEEIVKTPSTQDYKYGTTVKLTAQPNTGWYFDRWEEDLTGEENPKQITVDSEKNVTAHFKETSTVSGQITLHNSTGYTAPSSLDKQTSQVEINKQGGLSEFRENEIIIKYKDIVSTQSIHGLEVKNNLTKMSQMEIDNGKVALYQILENKTVSEMVDKFKDKEEVEWIEPNYLLYTLAIPSDPDYTSQWGFVNLNMEAAWDKKKNSDSVTVAVIDSGIIPNHPDLVNNLLQGADFVGGTNNAPTEDYNMTDSDPTDETTYLNGGSHGTHVAGIIGAVGNNNQGVTGVNWSTNILPIRVLGADGSGTNWDIAEGIYYAIDQGTDVINLSLGGPSESNLLKNAVDYAEQSGVITFAASGNDGDYGVLYPARYDSTVAVGATNINNQVTSYSNHGPNVDLTAPGGTFSYLIYSTWGYYSYGTIYSGYEYMQGTSMATPYASGVAALLIASGVNGVQNIKDRMTSTAVDLGFEGKDNYYGYGLVDAYGALLDKKLKNPYVLAGKVVGDFIKVMSEVVQVNDDGSYQLTEVEEGTVKIYGWRDVDENQEINAGDYWGVSSSSIEVAENSSYTMDVDIYYVTEESATSLRIKGLPK